MATVTPTLEPIHHVGKTTGTFGQIRRVNLRDIAKANDLGTRAGSGDQRLHLFGRQVLGFVNDQVLVDEGAASHEIKRLDLDTRPDQFLRCSPAPFARIRVGFIEDFEIVIERAHPG